MNNLIRERKGMLILSLLVILLPLGVGLFLWNQLPDQVRRTTTPVRPLLSLGCLCLWRRSRCCCWW